MRTVMLVFGTRPEAIKMCPLVQELKKRRNLRTLVCVSGQHREMLDGVLRAFDIHPDFDLDVMRPQQSVSALTAHVIRGMDRVLAQNVPDVVLVHGDTTTAYAAALAAFYRKIPVGHIEAGLRTYDLAQPFPEELNRQAISLMARYHFAPTEQAGENLLREGKADSAIFVTGNTVIDAMRTTVREDYTHPELAWAREGRLLLFTAHRRESLGKPLRQMLRALRRILNERSDLRVIYPVHRNPSVREIVHEELAACPRLHLTDPLAVTDFHNLLARCELVLTDSGGVQEEAVALGKPVLVMRNTTERPEGIVAGGIRLVGSDEATIVENVLRLLDDKRAYAAMANAPNPFGDGHACERISDILEKELEKHRTR